MRIITVSLIVGILIGWSLDSVVRVADSSPSEGTIIVAQHFGSQALCVQLLEENYKLLDEMQREIKSAETRLKNYMKDAFRDGVNINIIDGMVEQQGENLLELATKYRGEVPNALRISLHCPLLSTA